jgi:hypothetical protein
MDETPGGPHANATVQTDGNYDRLRMQFQYAYLEHCTEDELDQTIIHEWLHVAMRDFDHSIETIEDALSPGVCQQWADSVEHEREGLVDRLATALLLLHKGEKPRFSP